MAIRYVKDFEFPSAAGFSDSAPSKVTGPMFAKGGKVEAEKAPKGLMVIIGVGKPKGPMKKAEGGKAVKVPLPTEAEAPYPSQWPMPSDEQINKENWNQRKAIRRAMGAKNTGSDTFKKGGKVDSVPVKDIKSGKIPQSTDEDFYGKAKDMPMPTRRPSMMKKGGYAEGGMKAEQGVALPDMSPEKEMFEVYDRQSGDVVGTYGSLKRASRAVDRRDNEYGGYRYGHRPVAKAKGGAVHDDAAQDKAMIKSMIKPSALKKAMGGPAVQMAKSNAVEASMKGQKKTGYADGGDIGLAAPRMASPLQAMAARTRSVPVAPRGPMIPQQADMPARGMQAAAPGGTRIGVGMRRPGQPNVGAIRAAMARAATQAMPESAPSMMKKGGKVKC
ncbi:hypothetical protein UFOVP1417_72 [uncultured Caudovirales phage]|uniref:Uncharacterized protein n=1 Tax=uncultured Caudovirales phage TaxID=2100421 RepID=A0A6J5SCE1_9CAUD|nr:hypothetical protein UFOVP664_15 [uncultured Caudovirales phage]CAB4196190.1 hypothetical protein UFOVP1303_63 [uncultured Caudovirales phage]CAB4211059.1 hypothetical protein UFOVP1417_72 [uncultured Caudovirales phage]CAB5226798.1 hypothetical protein UFOVP1517_39 [uncultured Caudovirales phage]